ncbi:hypothetical protein EIP86_006412 [Pleurotus ostreatoroseus]|nr:hypothetical protein EIP86_006412 [Pleurotus ostreatoroseus]
MESELFSYPDADLVLCSSSPDRIQFHVHKCVLAASSTFFDDMFSLPQGPTECASPPVVDVAESTHTLENLLRLIYPVPRPKLDSLDELVAMLEVATKYEVASAIEHLRRLLVQPEFLSSNPLRVYAIACRFELEEESKIASQHTLCIKVTECPLSEDLKYISAYQYHRLLDLQRRRAKMAQDLIVYRDEVKCMMCNGTHYGAFYPPKWWKDWEARAKAELHERPTTDVIFSWSFLAESAKAGCERCGGSIVDAHVFLEKLRKGSPAEDSFMLLTITLFHDPFFISQPSSPNLTP